MYWTDLAACPLELAGDMRVALVCCKACSCRCEAGRKGPVLHVSQFSSGTAAGSAVTEPLRQLLQSTTRSLPAITVVSYCS